MKELFTSFENDGQKLIVKKNYKLFILYALIMIGVAIIFYNMISTMSGDIGIKWPFYLLIVAILAISLRYFKIAIDGFELVFDKSSETAMLHDGKLIKFNDISYVLIRFRNVVDTHFCYLELVFKNGSCYQICKSDITFRKNIESTANHLSKILEAPIKIRGRSFNLL